MRDTMPGSAAPGSRATGLLWHSGKFIQVAGTSNLIEFGVDREQIFLRAPTRQVSP